ncbi:hypothetical protein PENSPDRAFT_663043 [Peniophora sp. CONT]|nr:hypothetical protein PENSPDRAFT_663043 [Peniophora sp. CONT]
MTVQRVRGRPTRGRVYIVPSVIAADRVGSTSLSLPNQHLRLHLTSYTGSRRMQDLSSSDPPNHLAYVELPIGRLNVDVLRLIFERVAHDSRLNCEQPHLDHWIRLGHVCRLWRSTLLGMPKLWARDILAFGLGSALDDILHRAHDVPLDLELPGGKYLPSTAIDRIAPLIPRARVLACTIATPEERRTVLDAISSQPAPIIQSLKLDVLQKTNPGHISGPGTACTTCIQHLPLRRLELRNIIIRPPLSGGLTSWALRCHGQWINHERLTLEEILTALVHNPRLERLVLYEAVREQNPTTALPCVTLSSLRIMHIYQRSNPPPYALLDHFRFPNPIMEDSMVSDTVVETATGVSATLTHALAVYARSPAFEYVRHLRVQCEPEDQLVEIHIDQCHHLDDVWKPTAPFEVLFRAPQWQSSFHELSSTIVQELIKVRIPTQVTELSWHVGEEEGGHTIEYWDTLLRPFIATETLFLDDFNASRTEVIGLIAMLDALACTRSDGPLLPRLQWLVTCDEHAEIFEHGLPQLRRTLQRRAKMHVPIRGIRFMDVSGPRLTVGPGIASGPVETMSAQIQELVADLGISVERLACWEEIDGKMDYRGTKFVFDYRAYNVTDDA